MFATLVWGAPEWAVPTIALVAIAFGLLIWSYTRAAVRPGVRWIAATLKLIGIAGLAWCLVEPLYSGLRPRPKANVFLLLADNSQSMNVRDRVGAPSRADQMLAQLKSQANWQLRLDQDFDVRRYAFDEQLRAVDDYQGMDQRGIASRLGGALTTLGQRFTNRPVAGVLLFTDGNSTDDLSSLNWRGMPRIFPVVSSSGRTANDISLQRVTVSQSDFEAAPVTVRAEVISHGYAGKRLVAQLLDRSGTVVEALEADGLADGKLMEFRFQVRPEYHGVGFYRVRVGAKGLEVQFDQPEKSTEATLENNQRTVAVDRGGGPFRVLYVAGRPNWEYKFLRRALAEDPEVALIGLVRMARKKPKFEFRQRAEDQRNEFYKGFDNKSKETAEQYDEPVLIRLGTLDEFELRDGFPTAADQLFRYDALIVDDLEASFFTPDQMALVRRYVSQRGGGFLMLGGQESFQKGGYQDTPIGEVLPVYLRSASAALPTIGHRLDLTRDGWLQPWTRLRTTRDQEQLRLSEMPPFRTINRVSAIKPGATEVLQAVDDAGQRVPALVTQRFGKGRTAAMLIGDYWRWGLHRPEPQSSDLGRAWRQTVRWLVSDVPRRVELTVRPERGGQSATVQLQVRLADAEYRPLDNAHIKLTVTDPEKQEIILTTTGSSTETGVYTAQYWPHRSGAYHARVTVRAEDESDVGSREVGWVSEPAADEFRHLEPNRDALQQIAQQTGGEVVAIDKLDRFVAGLPNRKIPITERWVYPLWDQWWVLCLAIACLCGEWGL